MEQTNGSTSSPSRAESRDRNGTPRALEPYGSGRGVSNRGPMIAGRRPEPYGVRAREQTACRFCRRGEKYIDYKDVETLQKLLTNRGKIYSRKRSGNCAKCQRKAKMAIKRARFMALLPFTL